MEDKPPSGGFLFQPHSQQCMRVIRRTDYGNNSKDSKTKCDFDFTTVQMVLLRGNKWFLNS